METRKLVNVIKKNGIGVSSFIEMDDQVDANIDLMIPNRKIYIQIAEYDPNHGLIITEEINSGDRVLFRTLNQFRLSKDGVLKMLDFLKGLGEN
jgi:hypothetical protein